MTLLSAETLRLPFSGRLGTVAHRDGKRRGDSERPEAEHGFRPDVQGLRAIAVGLVVLYHLYPSKVTGGYVGVDVFFVISGYLITGHLARGLERRHRVNLLDFYGRRARRLLPAAAVVLLASWGLSRWLLPVTQIPAAENQIRASALYFQNWVLAHNSVSYLNQNAAPSPVEHFWSLSVEEQFYLVWPLLFVTAGAVAFLVARRSRAGAHAGDLDADRPRRTGRTTLLVLAVAVVAASLSYSVIETQSNPPAAYFITTTRMWELGLGGVLALLPAALIRRIGRVGVLAWAGFAMILVSAFTLTGASAFPGWVALFPVLGAALMIACGSGTARIGTSWFTASRPFVFVGDISYSLYLWHWPLIVFWLAYRGGSIGIIDGPLIIVVSVLLSWLTKVLVEDRVRRARLVVRHTSVSLATALSVAVPAVLVTVFAISQPGPFTGHLDHNHPGAAAIAEHRPAPKVPFVPPLADVPKDLPLLNGNGCEVGTQDSTSTPCTFGDTKNPTLKVALVGDSHAAEWSSALDSIAKQRHWEMVGEVHAACRWTSTMTILDGNPFTACHDWGANVLNDLLTKIKPDVVIVTDRAVFGTVAHPTPGPASRTDMGRGMATYLQTLINHGIKVVGIQETPELSLGQSIPDCLASRTGSIKRCSAPASKALWKHTVVQAAAAVLGKKFPVVDMNDLMCANGTCPPVVGNVVVYRDDQHLAKTFSLTLAPALERRLLATGEFDMTRAKSAPKVTR